jgi:chromosome segregation ATPase
MSIVNLLYGVTMQIRGVSKKISVRFGDDEEEAAAVA